MVMVSTQVVVRVEVAFDAARREAAARMDNGTWKEEGLHCSTGKERAGLSGRLQAQQLFLRRSKRDGSLGICYGILINVEHCRAVA